MTYAIPKSSIDFSNRPRQVKNAAARLTRDVGIAVAAGLLANLVWASLPSHQAKVTAQAPVTQAASVASAAPTVEDIQNAAAFQQMALAKVSPLKPESEVIPPAALPLNIAPALAAPLARPSFEKAKLEQKPQIRVKPLAPVAVSAAPTVPALYYTEAESSLSPDLIAAPAPKPSLLKRVASASTETMANAFDKTVGFVGGLMPRF